MSDGKIGILPTVIMLVSPVATLVSHQPPFTNGRNGLIPVIFLPWSLVLGDPGHRGNL